jgi:hypothetical protein
MTATLPEAYVCVISPKSRKNYEICRRLGLWGFTRQAQRSAQSIRPGALLWFYVSGKGFVALAQATAPPEPFPTDQPVPWPDSRDYALRLPIRFVADITQPIRPAFQPGFGGYKSDPDLGIGSNELMRGFFKLSPTQHALLVERSRGDVQADYQLVTMDNQPAPSNPQPVDNTNSLQTTRMTVERTSTEPGLETVELNSLHTKAQWQLARMGRALGLEVWIPRSDRHRSYRGALLADLCAAELPSLGLPTQAQAIIENIDVLWIDAGVVVCAFEVEHSTAVYSGLLRMSDLVTVQPYTSIKLFIVASADRRGKVARELMRPTFAKSKPPLAQICQFLSYERLDERLDFAEEHGPYLKFDWVGRLAEPLVPVT